MGVSYSPHHTGVTFCPQPGQGSWGHQYHQCLSTGSGSRSCCIRDNHFSQLYSTLHSRDHSRLTWCVAGSTDERSTIRDGSNVLGPATGYWNSTIFCCLRKLLSVFVHQSILCQIMSLGSLSLRCSSKVKLCCLQSFLSYRSV
jgi:hypothetical protein